MRGKVNAYHTRKPVIPIVCEFLLGIFMLVKDYLDALSRLKPTQLKAIIETAKQEVRMPKVK